jgi:hypothetical protein
MLPVSFSLFSLVLQHAKILEDLQKTHFIPAGNGEHGSKALWEEKTDNAEYGVAVKFFLGVE